jgi:ribonuclease HI
LTYSWASGTTDPRALQVASGSGRIAACWYTQGLTSGSSFTVDVNLTDGLTHTMALYAVDWDGAGPRSETVSILSAASGAVLNSQTLSSFQGGQYLVWNVTGHIQIRVTNLVAGSNAVISGLFFAPSQASANTATFITTDGMTQGSWEGVYGADGYNVINGPVNYPSYATVTPAGNLSYLWTASILDPRALQKPGLTTRIAACWYSPALTVGSSFNVQVNLTDQKPHEVALYMLDWDGFNTRSQQVQILDAVSGAVLDSRTVSSFSTGQYLVWTLTGNVRIQVTNNVAGYNGVISGLFFGQ